MTKLQKEVSLMVNSLGHRALSLLLAFLLASAFSFSQEREDFGARMGISAEKRLWKRFSVGLGEEFRMKNNCQDVDKWVTETDVSYTVAKRIFKIGLGYDLIGDWDEYVECFEFKHRFNGYFVLKHDISRFNISWKSRYQVTYKDESTGPVKWNPKNYWRNKLNVSYNIRHSHFEPYLSFECFYQHNNYKGNVIDRLRGQAGVAYEFNKHHSIDFSVRCNQDIYVKKPERNCQLGLFYNYSF